MYRLANMVIVESLLIPCKSYQGVYQERYVDSISLDYVDISHFKQKNQVSSLMKSHMLDMNFMIGIGVQYLRMVSHVIFLKDNVLTTV